MRIFKGRRAVTQPRTVRSHSRLTESSVLWFLSLTGNNPESSLGRRLASGSSTCRTMHLFTFIGSALVPRSGPDTVDAALSKTDTVTALMSGKASHMSKPKAGHRQPVHWDA